MEKSQASLLPESLCEICYVPIPVQKNSENSRKFRRSPNYWNMADNSFGRTLSPENDPPNGILVFTNRQALKTIASCENILGDGTFISCPHRWNNFMYFSDTRIVPYP